MIQTAKSIGTLLAKTLKALMLLVAVVVCVDVIGALTVGYPPALALVLHELPFMGKSFSKVEWAEAGTGCRGLSDWECEEQQSACLRGPMVRDLVRAHIALGETTRQGVLDLLGPTKGRVKIEGQTCDDYNPGMCSGLGWDYDSLYVCFAGDGTVSAAGHVQH